MLELFVEGTRCFKKAFINTFKHYLNMNIMNKEEAMDILNVPSSYTLNDLKVKYEKYYNANSPKKGGSSYIQSKIKGAFILLTNYYKRTKVLH